MPDAVEDAIVRAMAKVPADRFRSAIDFANALTDNEGAARRRLHSLKAMAIPAGTMADVQVAGGREEEDADRGRRRHPVARGRRLVRVREEGGERRSDSSRR